MKIDFAGSLNGGRLMRTYQLVFDQPTVIQVALVVPDVIRWDSSQNVPLATVKLPAFSIGKTSSLTLRDIRVKVNADYPLGTLAMRLADHIRDHQFDGKLPLTLSIRVDMSMSTSSLWFPLKIKKRDYEIKQTVDLAPLIRQVKSTSGQVNPRSYAEIASIEFQPETDPDKIELVTRFQYPKSMIPSFLKMDIPALQFDVRSKTTLLVEEDPTGNSSFATVITHSHTLQAEEHTELHDNHFAVFVSLSNERAEPLVRFLERLRDGERSFMISVIGSDIPAAPPILPTCSSCTLQKIIKTFELRLPFSDLGISDPLSLDYQKLSTLTVQERNTHSEAFPSDIPIKREKEALSIGIVGLDPQTSSFQIELHIAITFLERLIPFNYHKLKGQLPSIFLRNMLTYTSSRDRQSMLAQMGIKHLPGKTDGTATAIDFLVTVTMSDMTKFIKIAHKLYQMERVSYEELMRELLELKSVLFTGSRKNLASRILSIFEVELPLDRVGRAGFRRSKAVGAAGTDGFKASIPLEGIPVSPVPPPPSSNHRHLVHHDVSLTLHSKITTVEATGSIHLHKHPLVSAPRIKLFWETMDLSLFPVSNGSASHFSDVELFHTEVKKGYFWLSLAARNPLTLLHGGNISFSASFHSDEIDADSPHGIIAAWKYMILQWYNEPQFTRFRVSGSVGKTGKIDMEACLPPRASLLRLTPKNKWEDSPAQASLSDLISSLIQTQLKIVGFSDATLKMLFELPSFGRCKLPAVTSTGSIIPIISLNVSLPKITMNVCQTRPGTAEDANSPAMTPEEREDEDAWWRTRSRKTAATKGPCMVQVSLQPIEASIDFINGRPCDIETRLRHDTDFKSHTTDDLEDEWQPRGGASMMPSPSDLSKVHSNHGKLSHLQTLDPTEALFADHHKHYMKDSGRRRRDRFHESHHYRHGDGSTPDSSALKNLLPLSVVVVSLEDAITAYQEITQQQLWKFRISLGNIPTSSIPAEQKSTIQASEILLINRFINGIGQMFPVEFPMAMPNKSERPPVKYFYDKEPLPVDIELSSRDRQSLEGKVSINFPLDTLYQSQLHPSSSDEESQVSVEDMTDLSFLLTVQWGDTIINLRHRNSYLRIRLNQGQIGMRHASGRIKTRSSSLPFFSKHLIADFKMFIDDRDFDSAQLRALLGVLQSAFEVSSERASSTRPGEHQLGLTRAEERISKEDIELTVIVGKYDHELEERGLADVHERKSRTRFFHKHQLDDSLVDKYKLNTTLQISTMLRLANLTYNRYQSGRPTSSPSSVAAELERGVWAPHVSVTVDVAPIEGKASVIQLPCLFPRICRPQVMEAQRKEVPTSRSLFSGKIRVHHAFQMGADLFAHGLARVIHKLNLRRYPTHILLRIRTKEDLGLNLALNDIDVLEVIVPKQKIQRRAELPYPGLPPSSQHHADPSRRKVGMDSKLISVRLCLPRYYHDITSLLSPISIDPIGRINLGRVPQFHFKGVYHDLLHSPVNAMPTNERTLETNLLSTILCGISPETLLGTMPIKTGSGGMKITLLDTNGDEFRLDVSDLQVLNPSSQVTIGISEPVSVTFSLAGYPLLRAEVMGSPVRLVPGYNSVGVHVTVSKTAFGRLERDDPFAQRLFFDFVEGILLGRPMDITISLHIGKGITLAMPVHFPERASYIGSLDLSGLHPTVFDADGLIQNITSEILPNVGKQVVQVGNQVIDKVQSVVTSIGRSIWNYFFEYKDDPLYALSNSTLKQLTTRSDQFEHEDPEPPPKNTTITPQKIKQTLSTFVNESLVKIATIPGKVIATVRSTYRSTVGWLKGKLFARSDERRLFPRSGTPEQQPKKEARPWFFQRAFNYLLGSKPAAQPEQQTQPTGAESPAPRSPPAPQSSTTIHNVDVQAGEELGDSGSPAPPSGGDRALVSESNSVASRQPVEPSPPTPIARPKTPSTPLASYNKGKDTPVQNVDRDYEVISPEDAPVNNSIDSPLRPPSRHHSIGSDTTSIEEFDEGLPSPQVTSSQPRPSTAPEPSAKKSSSSSGSFLGSVFSSLGSIWNRARGKNKKQADANIPPTPTTGTGVPSSVVPIVSTLPIPTPPIQDTPVVDDLYFDAEAEFTSNTPAPTNASRQSTIKPSAIATHPEPKARSHTAPTKVIQNVDVTGEFGAGSPRANTRRAPTATTHAPIPSTMPMTNKHLIDPSSPQSNSWAIMGHKAADLINHHVSHIPKAYKILNPNQWQLSFLSAQMNIRIEERRGPNWGFNVFAPSRGFTSNLFALLAPEQCRANAFDALLKAGPVNPEPLVDKPSRSREPFLLPITTELMHCANQDNQSIFNIDAHGHATGNLDYLPIHGTYEDLGKALLNIPQSDGVCASLNRSAIGIAFTDKNGKRIFGEAAFSAPYINIALSPFTDPCHHSGSCQPKLFIQEPIGPIWESRTRSTPEYPPSLPLPLVTHMHERGQVWRVKPIPIHVSWKISFGFFVSELVQNTTGTTTTPNPSPPGLALVFRATNVDRQRERVVSDGAFGCENIVQSSALVLDFSTASVSWMHNGNLGARLEKKRGGMPKSLVRGHKYFLTLRYDPGVPRFLVDVHDEHDDITYSSIFRNIDLPAIIGDEFCYLGITASANNAMHAVRIFNWQLHAISPDFARTRIHYLEKYAPSPGQMGAFLIQLSDSCDDHLLQAPRRIFVRLRRLSLTRAWLQDIYQMNPPSKPGSTPSPSSKQQTVNDKSNLPFNPPQDDTPPDVVDVRQPVIIDTSLSLIVRQGLYLVRYPALAHGRYAIDIAMPPFIYHHDSDDSYPTPSKHQVDQFEWTTVQDQQVYIRSAFHAFDNN